MSNESGVLPIIGVILMVAITVILAAVIAAFVFAMQGSVSKDVQDMDCPVYDYGNGILYFGCLDVKFPIALSQYTVKHNVTITAIAQGRSINLINGYFVVVSNV